MENILGKFMHFKVQVGEQTDEQKMDKLIEEIRRNNAGSSFDQLWRPLCIALNAPEQFTINQKLIGVAKMILKTESKILRFFRISEFFEHNTKHMIEIMEKISGESEITEFRFLKEDSLRGEEEFQDWNDRLLDEELKRDLEQVQVELMNMSKLISIKIDVFSFNLTQLEDLCGKLPSLRTVEVVINQEVSGFHDYHIKKVRNDMGHLEVLKYNGNIRNLEQDNIPFFVKNLDEFFIHSLLGAKIIGQPGRCIDLELLVGEMPESDKSNLRCIAHKMLGDATLPYGANFPQLNQLEINWSEPGSPYYSCYGFLKSTFPKLKQLTLTNLPSADTLRIFVNVYMKKQLMELRVYFKTSEKLCMSNFERLSKTLRKLVVRNIKPLILGGVSTEASWSLRKFESLTELEIEFAVNRDYRGSICVVPICSLLSAPKLKKVKLLGKLAVDVDDLQDLHDQIKSEDILQKVNHFEMQLLKEGSKSGVRLNQAQLKRKKELCSSITDEFQRSKEGLIVNIGFVPFN